jgi:hypothetical protein
MEAPKGMPALKLCTFAHLQLDIWKMKQQKIKTIHVIDFNSIEKHVDWIILNRLKKHNRRLYPAKAIKLDFSLVRFLKPYHIAPLACLIHEYQSQGFSIILHNTNPKIDFYLESFGFDQFCQSHEDDGFQISNDKKTFPLWLINEAKKEFYTIQVQKYFENNHFGGQDLFVLGSSMAELMNNIFDHSHSKIPGYTFTQYNTHTATIINCVCDFGIGIPTSVNNYLKSVGKTAIADDEALKRAFELRFSAMTNPRNRGLGWDTIFNSIKSMKGKLHIVSNRALFVMHDNGKITSHLMDLNFPGTLVVITLNTHNLPIKDELGDELDLI